MDYMDRGLRKLIADEAARLDPTGAPVDPAQTVRYDHDRAILLDERRRETMALAAEERASIETHWDRWGQMLDRQEAVRSHPAPGPSWQPQQASPVTVNINLGSGAPYYQPAPWQPPQIGPLFNPAAVAEADRRFGRRMWIGIVTCAIATLAMLWMLAGAMQYRAEQYVQKPTTTQTQEMP